MHVWLNEWAREKIVLHRPWCTISIHFWSMVIAGFSCEIGKSDSNRNSDNAGNFRRHQIFFAVIFFPISMFLVLFFLAYSLCPKANKKSWSMFRKRASLQMRCHLRQKCLFQIRIIYSRSFALTYKYKVDFMLHFGGFRLSLNSYRCRQVSILSKAHTHSHTRTYAPPPPSLTKFCFHRFGSNDGSYFITAWWKNLKWRA